MDGMGRAVGAGVPIPLDGETLILQPLTLEDFGLLEQKILADRPNPMDLARQQVRELYGAKEIPAESKDKLAESILREAREEARRVNKASNADVVQYMDSVPGLAFTYWLMLRREHGEKWSPERLCEHLQRASQQEFERLLKLRDQASGIDEMGNSTGPTQTKQKKGRRGKRRATGG